LNEAFYRDALEQLRADIESARAEEAEILRELDQVRTRLEATQARLHDMRRAASSMRRLLGDVAVHASDADVWTDVETPVRHADVAEEVLREAGHPLRVPEIGQRMAQKGHPLPSDSRLRDSAVFAAMKRRPHVFGRAGRGLWMLLDWGTELHTGQNSLDFTGGDPIHEGSE
jgi:hypothetical protein